MNKETYKLKAIRVKSFPFMKFFVHKSNAIENTTWCKEGQYVMS